MPEIDQAIQQIFVRADENGVYRSVAEIAIDAILTQWENSMSDHPY